MICYNLKKNKKNTAGQTFDKMRYLVHEVFFHIQDYVRVWYVFKGASKAELSCSSTKRQDKAFVVAAECDSKDI